MSSTTPRVSLYKPAGGENVNVTTDINNNLDKLDTNLNFRVAANTTARNAISPFWEGLNVRDTDSGKLWVSNGSAPISASWDQIVTANTFTTAVNIATSATGNNGIVFKTNGDAADRFRVRGDGQMVFGGGTTSPDTNLYRSAADTLKTDDTFVAGTALTSNGDVNVGGILNFTGKGAKKWSDGSSSTTVANTVTETVIATLTIPANDMEVGAVYRITAWGTAGVAAATTPTISYRARISGVAGTALGTTAFTASSGVANKVWKSEVYLVVLTTGASGTVFANLHTTTGITVAGGNPVATPGTAMDGGSVITVDTTVSRDLVLTATWGAANASNTITCRGFAAERIS